MRKRTWLVIILLTVVLAVTIGANTAFAQETQTPPNGGAWNTGGYCQGAGGVVGLSDPVTLERVAGVLGLTSEQLTARLAQGETIAQVAQAQGVASSLVVTTILAPQSEMLQARVKYGYLTEAQVQAIQEQARLRIEQTITVPLNGSSATSPTGGYAQRCGPGYGGGAWGGPGGGMMGGGRLGRMGNW